jgi:hypothetical protein
MPFSSLASGGGTAGSVMLAWNPSISTNVVGYNIYYGPASGVYTNSISVAGATATNATITGLVQGALYYFAATASDALGNQSPYSNETTYSVPLPTNTNTPPTLNAIGNVAINENAGVQTVNLSGISSGAANEIQTLTVTASSSNPALIPNPAVTYTSPNSTGSLTLAPLANANGLATITVTVNDNGTSNNIVIQTFTVTVNPVNQAPTLNLISNVTLNENAGAQTVNLSGISSGAANEAQTLIVTAVSSNPTLIPNPMVNYTSPNAAGSLTFTPAVNANGSAIVTVTVNDGGTSNNIATRTFTVAVNSVNQAPTLNAIGNLTINENAGLQTVNLSGISSGAANEIQTLTVTASSSNPAIIPNPAVSYTSPNATGSLAFTPAANASGSATVTVTVNDGGTSNNVVTKTFTVSVNPVNQTPTLNAITSVSINENAGTQIVALSGISSGAANETQTLTVTAASSNPAIVPNPTVTYTSPNSTGSLAFTPAANASGSAIVTVTVNDGGISNNIVTKTFTITVNPVNQVPTLNALGNLAINENAGLQTVNLSGISSGAANETQTLTVTAISSNPTLVPNPAVTYTSPSTTGSLTFTPVANANGSATITVTVNDGGTSNNIVTKTFTVTVNPVNQAPTLNPISNVTINENAGTQTVAMSGISSGAANETQTLTVTATSSNPSLIPNPAVNYTSPNATGSLTFTPTANASGSATVTVTVNDGGTSNNVVTKTFTVSVNPVNQTPTLNAIGNLTINENAGLQTVNLSGISSGAANEVQTLTVTATSSNPALIPNPAVTYTSPSSTGSLTFTPAANAGGSAIVTVTVNDGGTSNSVVTQTFTVTVNPVNQTPTLNAITSVSINENAGTQTAALSGISSGAANEIQTLTVTATSSNPALIPNPTVIYTSPNATGSLAFTPAANASGTATVTVTVNDNGASNNVVSQSFTVTVNAVNQTPTLNALGNLTVNENAGLQTVNLSGISSGAANEIQTLTVTAASSNPALVPNPTVTYTSPNNTGTLNFTPALNGNGTAIITVTVNDNGASNNIVTKTFTVIVNPVNQTPTLNAIGNVTINENAGLQTVNLSGISSGAANEVQTLTVTTTSSNQGLIPNPVVSYTSPNGAGSLTFTPAANAYGTATITVTVNDNGASNNIVTQAFTVIVNPVNQAPTLNAIGNLTINENAGLQTVNLSGISSGLTNATQTLTVTAASSNPAIIPNPAVSYTSPNATGSLTFTPAANASGTATVTVTVNNNGVSNNIVTQAFTVTVNPVNQTPTLNAIGNLTINENAGVQTVNLSGISSGAANEVQTLAVTATSSNPALVPNPTVAYTSPNSTGTLNFTPAVNGNGTATITVTVNDSGTSNNVVTKTFTVTVNPVNQAPTLNAIGNVTINENAGLQTVSLSGISSGAASEVQTLAVTATSSNPALVPNPTVAYTSPNSTGTLNFTPAVNGNGTATITVTVNDGGTSNNVVTKTFTVTVNPVNQAPTLNAIANLTLNENAGLQTVNLGGISAGAANEVQTLTVTAGSSNPALIPNPTVTYTSPTATGSLTFTPAANASGTATITVTVNDGGTSNNVVTQTFTVTVNPVNQTPTLNTIGNVTINENAGLQTVNLSGISSGAANEIQTLTVTAASSNPALIPNPTVTYTSPNSTGSLAFTPAANSSGMATVTVTVNDNGASNNVVTQTFSVTVNPVNQTPTLNPISNVTINENAVAQTVNLSGISSGAANEVQSLTVTATSSNPALVPNPTVAYTSPNSTGSLTFTPAANATGSATVTVTVNDNGASNNVVTQTFTVTVNPVNQTPTLNAIGNVTINENAGLQTVNLSGISSGAASEVQTMTVTATSSSPSLIPNPTVTYTSPNATGSLSFTPAANANGTVTVTVTVNDGGSSNNVVTQTFTVTVNPVNQTPTLNTIGNLTINENAGVQTMNLSGISSGAANEVQTLAVTATSSNPALVPNPTVSYTSPNSTGSLTFTPAANANGTTTITVTVNDGGTSNNVITRTFTVTVNAVNQTPTLNAIANLTLNENAGLQTVNLGGISAGAANEVQTLTVTAASSNPALIPNPTVTYTSPNATGSLTFTPAANANGTTTITVTVNDGGTSNNVVTRTFTVTVNAVNQTPTLNAIANLTLNENAGLQTVNLSGISAGAANEVQTLTVTATSSNPALIPNPAVTYTSPNVTGSLTFTPAANANGTTTVTVTVNDGGTSNNVVTKTFTVTVNPVNQTPTLNTIGNVTINENAGLQTVNLSGISSGAANEVQTLTVTAASGNPALIPNPTVTYTSPNATGSLTFTPAADANGTATITVTVNDNGASNNIVTRTFTVTVNQNTTSQTVNVNPANQPPTLDPLNNLILAVSSSKQTISLTGISSGLTNTTQPLTVTATSSFTSLIPTPTISYTSPNTKGTLTLSPIAGVVGNAVVSVSVNNGASTNNTITRQFTVSVLTAYTAGKVASSLATAQPASRGQFAFTVGGVTGYSYVVQVSTNLANWISVTTNTAPFTFVDTNACQFKQRYYRSFYQP